MKLRFAMMCALSAACTTPDDPAIPSHSDTQLLRTCADEVLVPVDDASIPAEGLGFAALDVVRELQRVFHGEFHWNDGTTSGVLDPTGSGRRVRAVYPASSLTGIINAACPPYYALELGAELYDENGRIDETFTAELVITSRRQASFSMGLSNTDRKGTLDEPELDAPELFIEGQLDDGVWDGQLAWQSEHVQQTVGWFVFE